MYGPPEMEIEICAKREQAGSCLSQRMFYAFLSFYRWFVQVPTLMNILRAFQWVIVGSLPEESFEEEKIYISDCYDDDWPMRLFTYSC